MNFLKVSVNRKDRIEPIENSIRSTSPRMGSYVAQIWINQNPMWVSDTG